MTVTADVAQLYQRYGPKMVAFARRYVGDEAVAEDVVEELVQRWLERPPVLHDGERLTAFLSVSVYHAAIDWIRRERVEQGLAPRAEPGLQAEDRRRVSIRASSRNDDSRAQLQARLNAALGRLTNSDRLLLESHYGRALTAQECMDLLGLSRSAFHQRLHRARTRLLGLLEAAP